MGAGLPDFPLRWRLVGLGVALVCAGLLAVLALTGGDADPEVAGETEVGSDPIAVTVGEGTVWVTNEGDDTVTPRVDYLQPVRSTGRPIPVGDKPSGIRVGEGSVWVANRGDRTVTRLDPSTGAVRQTIAVGRRPAGVRVGEG